MTNSDGAGPVPWRQSPRRRAIAAAAVLVAAAALSAVSLLAVHWAAGSSARAQTPRSGLGFVALDRPARSLSLPNLHGKGTIDLAGLAGKPIVMNFWSSHCYPCQQETPLLASFYKASGGQVAIVGVDSNDTTAKAIAFVRAKGVSYPIGVDSRLVTADAYDVAAFPQTFFLDSAHRVVDRVFGPLTRATLDKGVRLMTAGDGTSGKLPVSYIQE